MKRLFAAAAAIVIGAVATLAAQRGGAAAAFPKRPPADARDPANGRPLWHARIGNVSNAPETCMLDGRQYVLVAAGDSLYAFTINP